MNRDYEGTADEIIALRIAQRGEAQGAAGYEDLFELAEDNLPEEHT